jgi:hypothetical protein
MMNAGEMPGRAVLTVAGRNPGGLIEWPAWESCEAGQRIGGRWQGMDGELLAAPASAGAPRREIADVIWCSRACASVRPEAWLGEVLRRHPGCAVAAVRLGAHACAVGTRSGSVLIVSLRGRAGLATCGPLLVASVAYAWLAGGWPLPILARTRLKVLSNVPALAYGMTGEVPIRLSFGLFGQRGAPGPDSPSLRRT